MTWSTSFGSIVLVIDASVLVPALTGAERVGTPVRARLRGADIAAPEVIDLECLSAFRGLVRGGKLDEQRAALAVVELRGMDVRRHAHRGLLARIWQLRENVSPYDAAYVALAEGLRATLLTADARLARAPGIRCDIEVVTA